MRPRSCSCSLIPGLQRVSFLYLIRCGCVGALTLAALVVGHVFLVVAFEQHQLRVALEREDVRRDAVEEPAIVRDDDGAAREGEQRLPRARAASRRRGRWSARRAAARCRRVFSTLARCTRLRSPPESSPMSFCCVGALEVEAPDVAARRRLVVADLDHVEAAGDLLPHGLACRSSACRDWSTYASFTVAPMRISPASGFSWPISMRNSVVLPAPFGPMMPTMPPRGRLKERLSISSRSPKPLLRPFASMTRSPRRSPGGM